MKRGIYTIADLRARSIVDPVTGCWHWQGASSKGSPRIWTIDYAIGDKRAMSAAAAVWHIAHEAPPRPGWKTFRRCVVLDCVCPVHVDQVRSFADLGRHVARNGRLKGKHTEKRTANAMKACAARGVTPTPPATVLAIRAASEYLTNTHLAREFGMRHQVVSRIRLGLSRQDVLAEVGGLKKLPEAVALREGVK